MLRILLVYQLVLRYISVNLETVIGLSICFMIYKELIVRRLLVYQLVLRYISVNFETFIGLSISFMIYKR